MSTEKNYVLTVDPQDMPLGKMEKMEAHQKAILHRAFSVFIFNTKGELLLQRRALDKYHSGGLWTNTCCSHPKPGQQTKEAASIRLAEEMGMNAELQFVRKFTYKTPFDNDLTEHEVDHIFVGYTDELPCINPEEVSEYKYAALDEIKKEMANQPEKFTTWFRIIFDQYLKEFTE